MSVHLHTLWMPQFGAEKGPRGPPRAIYEPGGQGSTELPMVLKGLNFKPIRMVLYDVISSRKI